MEIDRNKLSVPDAETERLGNVISAALRDTGTRTGPCPLPEEIAALVEGRIVGEKRDKILKHISSCDACCETFILTTELHIDGTVPEEIPKTRRNIIIFKPLALAASILIVIVSMYLFFKTGVPKTAEQLVEMEKPAAKGDIRYPPAPLLLESEFKDKEKKAESPPVPKRYLLPKAKKGTPITTEEDRLNKSEPGTADKKHELYKRTDDFKAAGEDTSRSQTLKSTPQEEVLDEANERTKTRGRIPSALEKAGKTIDTVPKELNVSTQEVEVDREEIAQKQEKRQVVTGNLSNQEDKVRSEKSFGFEKNMAWSQANLINQQSQVYRTHIPARELQDMFKDTIALSNQLKDPFEKIRKEAQETGDLKKIDTFVQGLAPLITIKSTENVSYIYPNIGYFLRMSTPGSAEYKFFNLARSGWCEPVSGCYDMDKEKLNRIIIGKTISREAMGKDDKSSSTNQLAQWEALYPQLNGIFRKVARYTIENIKQQSIIPAEKQ